MSILDNEGHDPLGLGNTPRCTRCNDTGEQRYWEGRWRDEKADNDRLRAALVSNADLLDPASHADTYTVDLRVVARNLRRSAHEPLGSTERLRAALKYARDCVMESFEHVMDADDQLMADARLRAIDSALQSLTPNR